MRINSLKRKIQAVFDYRGDIVKAYHLRAINSEQQKIHQTFYAKNGKA